MKRTLDEIGMYAMAAKPHMQLLGTTKKNQKMKKICRPEKKPGCIRDFWIVCC